MGLLRCEGRGVWAFVMIMGCLCVAMSAAEPVEFPDPALEGAIRNAIAKPTGPVEAADLGGLTELRAGSCGISDLSGLEHCGALELLSLECNAVSNVAPLAGLKQLVDLNLYDNQIADVGPLAGLVGLGWLSLAANQIADVSPLAGLNGLRRLSLGANEISDVRPLDGLRGLERLSLTHNRITSLQGLEKLTTLTELYLDSNQVGDLRPLARLVRVRDLFLRDNGISDLRGLEGLASLSLLELERNQVTDLGPLLANTGLNRGDAACLDYNWLDLGPGSEASGQVETLRASGLLVLCENQRAPAEPPSPTCLSIGLDAEDNVMLQWLDLAENEQGFVVQRRMRDGDGSWPAWATLVQLARNSNSHVDDSAACEGLYQYRVRSHNSAGPSNWAAPVAISCTPGRLPSPSNLRLKTVRSGQDVKVQWCDNSLNEDGFTVQRRHQRSDYTWAEWTTLRRTVANVTVFIDAEIPTGGWYQYRVRSHNCVRPSNWTDPVCILSEVTPCWPSRVAAQSVNGGEEVEVTWNDRSAVEDGYEVQRRRRLADKSWCEWDAVGQIGSNTCNFIDDSLGAAGDYQYRVRAFNEAGASSWAPPVTVSCDVGRCLAISAVAVQQANANAVSVVYGLNAAAEVTVEVRNIGGRIVKAIPCGAAVAGINTATWNLRNRAGAPVPSGMYLCTVTARGEAGGQASAVRTLRVRR